MNRQETAQVLLLMSAAYPQYPATPETVKVYADLLADLPFDRVVTAVKNLLKTTDRWLSVAAIREAVAREANVLCPERASAWAEVLAAVSMHGRSSRPTWSHPVIGEAVAAIGWYDICMSTNGEALRSQFWKSYDEFAARYNRKVVATDGMISSALGSGVRTLALEGAE